MSRQELPLRIEGFWWRIDQPEKRLRGTLNIQSDENPVLTLEVSTRSLFGSEKLFDCPLILGESKAGTRISLWKNLQLRWRMLGFNSEEIGELDIETVCAFVGVHFDDEKDIAFDSLIFHYQHLAEWLDHKPIEAVHNSKNPSSKFQLKYRRPKPINLSLMDWRIKFGSQWKDSNHFTSFSLQHAATCSVAAKNEGERTDFQSGIRVGHQMANFISLFIGWPITYTYVEGYIEKWPIEIYTSRDTNLPERMAIPNRYLLKHQNIKGKLSKYFKAWQKVSVEYESVIDLLSGLWNAPNESMHARFLKLTQALESFHARRFGGEYMPDQEYLGGLYKQLVDVLPRNLDESFRQSLIKGKLYYANKYSLRKRLEALVAHLEPLHLRFIPLMYKRLFAEVVAKSRNYYTHFSPDDKDSAMPGTKMAQANQQMLLMLQLLFLLEIGIEADVLSSHLSQWAYIKSNAYTEFIFKVPGPKLPDLSK